MNKIINYIFNNKEWIFSGVGLLIFTGIGFIIKTIRSKKQKADKDNTMSQTNDNHSSGIQIGIQNNYYGKDNTNNRPTN